MRIELFQLPSEALENIACRLDLYSLVALGSTCKAGARVAFSSVQFQHRLLLHFGIGIKSLPKTGSYKSIFTDLHTQLTAPFRFTGLSTDGGVDTSTAVEMVYWVDNMYAGDHLEFYCTEATSNVSTVAALREDIARERDERRRARVAFLEVLLRAPMSTGVGLHGIGFNFNSLGGTSLHELETILVEVWGLPEVQRRLMDGMLIRCAGDEDEARGAEVRVLQIIREHCRRFGYPLPAGVAAAEAVDAIGDGTNAPPAPSPLATSHDGRMRAKAGKPRHLVHPEYNVVSAPDDGHLLVDVDLAPSVFLRPQRDLRRLAVIDALDVSRNGGFTCPLRTAAVCSRATLTPCPVVAASVAAERGSHRSIRRAAAGGPVPGAASSQAPGARPPDFTRLPNKRWSSGAWVGAPSGGPPADTGTGGAGPEGGGEAHAAGADEELSAAALASGVRATMSPMMSALLQCCGYREVEAAVASGHLPPIVQRQLHVTDGSAVGIHVEFAPHPQGTTSGFWPLVWLQFFTEHEAKKIEARIRATARAPRRGAGSPSPLVSDAAAAYGASWAAPGSRGRKAPCAGTATGVCTDADVLRFVFGPSSAPHAPQGRLQTRRGQHECGGGQARGCGGSPPGSQLEGADAAGARPEGRAPDGVPARAGAIDASSQGDMLQTPGRHGGSVAAPSEARDSRSGAPASGHQALPVGRGTGDRGSAVPSAAEQASTSMGHPAAGSGVGGPSAQARGSLSPPWSDRQEGLSPWSGLHDSVSSGSSSLPSQSLESDGEDAGAALVADIPDGRFVKGRDRLRIELETVRAANMVAVQLLDQEDLMRAWGDTHPNPNIDVSYVRFYGRKVDLPYGAVLTPT